MNTKQSLAIILVIVSSTAFCQTLDDTIVEWHYKIEDEYKEEDLQREFQYLRKKKSVEAKARLARLYMKGYGTTKDHEKAVEILERIKDQSSYAKYVLGVMYNNGLGVGQNKSMTIQLYKQGASEGDPFCQNALGTRYHNGRGVTQNYEEAFRYYVPAADQGHRNSQKNLGVLYQFGAGVEQNDELALKWYTLSADQGNTRAQYRLALFYWDLIKKLENSDLRKALDYKNKVMPLLTTSAENGYSTAQHRLGDTFRYGWYFQSKDINKSISWYTKAADNSNMKAAWALAELQKEYSYKDLGLKAEWYQEAADKGDEKAMFQLGNLAETESEKRRWFEKAAELGSLEAMYALWNATILDATGNLPASPIYNPELLKDDVMQVYIFNRTEVLNSEVFYYFQKDHFSSSFAWLKKAADEGHAPSQKWLADILNSRSTGYYDSEKALYWYEKACDQKERYACETLYHITRN